MNPASEVRMIRKALGLSAKGLAEALQLGANGGRTVRRWEAGECPPSGPAMVAMRLLYMQEVGAQFAISEALFPDED